MRKREQPPRHQDEFLYREIKIQVTVRRTRLRQLLLRRIQIFKAVRLQRGYNLG